MEVVISYDNPRNVDEWNALCKGCGNFVQTTTQTSIDSLYRKRPIYIEVFDNEVLVGGVKLNIWMSSKFKVILPSLSKTLSQFGEYIIDFNNSKYTYAIKLINDTIATLIIDEKIVSLSVKGFYPTLYGSETPLLYEDKSNKPISKTDFSIAYIDLHKSEDDLYKCMHVKHRNMVNKALREELTFQELPCEPSILNLMLSETYSQQDKHAPDKKYIEKVLNVGKEHAVGRLFVVKQDKNILSSAYVQTYGKIADYSFGGNKKNDCGAGQFLQYEIFKALKNDGIEYYSLGQVANGIDLNNIKFSEGITRFKMRFGCQTSSSHKALYVYDKKKHFIWNLLCRWFL